MRKKIDSFLFFLVVLVSLAFTSSPLTEIETAVLKEDYETAKQLAENLLQNNLSHRNFKSEIPIPRSSAFGGTNAGDQIGANSDVTPVSALRSKATGPEGKIVRARPGKPERRAGEAPILDSKIFSQAQYYLGLSELRLGQYQEAVESFKKLIKGSLEPSLRDRVYLNLCDAYFLREEYPEALETGQTLLRLNPKSDCLSLIYLKMAKVSLKLAHWQEAHEYLDKIIHHFPESLEVPIAQQLLEEKQYFAVQVGSFTDRDRAEELAAELREKGEYAYIIETENAQEEKFYRVRAGELVSLREAQELKVKLAGQGYPTQIYP